MISMAEREKKLVYFTLILCLVFGSYAFLLEPLIQSIQEKEATYTQLSIEVDSYQLSMASAATLEAAYENNLKTLAGLEDSVGVYMQDEDLERLVTGLLQDHNLSTSSFSLTNNDTDNDGIDSTIALSKSVQLTISGNVGDCIDFVEELYLRSDVVLTQLNIDCSEATVNTYSNSVEGEFEIGFMLYMLAQQ